MRSQRFLFVVLVLVLGLVGCRKPRTFVLSKEQQKQIQGALLEAVPAVEHPVGALFDGGVKLVGVDLERDTVKAGQRLKVTWIWEVVGEIPPGQWMIFVHFENPGKKRTTHDHQAVGELHPVKNWKKGDVIRDVQTIDVAKGFPGGAADLYVGLFDEGAWRDRRENIRMKVTNDSEPTVHVDKEGRLRAATVKIAGEGAGTDRASHTRARNHRVYRAASAPTMDGRLDEVLWRGARPTAPFVQPHGQVLSPKWMTQARLLWDDDALYVGISGRDDDVTNTNLTHDSTLWEQDVFEVYLDPGSDGENYVELQVSPAGVTFDAVFAKHRRPKWQEAAKAELAGLEAFAAVEGTVNDSSGEPDSRWSVEVKIPWASLPGMDGPPTAGDELAANFYRIDGKTDARAGFMGAWSPAGGDFHNTSGFGKLRFLAAAPPPRPASRRPTLPGAGAAAAAKAASQSGLLSRPLRGIAAPTAAPGKPTKSGSRPASARPIPRLTPSVQRALRSGALRPSKGPAIPVAPTGKKP
jgi:hypothetical protein